MSGGNVVRENFNPAQDSSTEGSAAVQKHKDFLCLKLWCTSDFLFFMHHVSIHLRTYLLLLRMQFYSE